MGKIIEDYWISILGVLSSALLIYLLLPLLKDFIHNTNEELRVKKKIKKENKNKLEQIKIKAPNLLKISKEILKKYPALDKFWFDSAGGRFEFESFDKKISLYEKSNIDRTAPIQPRTIRNEIDIFIDKGFLKLEHDGLNARQYSFNDDLKECFYTRISGLVLT